MATETYTNLASTTLAAAISTTNGTSITVTSAAGFPTAPQFRVVIDSEIMIVTALSGAGNTTWTVTRGAEGTTAATHTNSTAVTHVLTAGAVDQIRSDLCQKGTYANLPSASKNGIMYWSSNGPILSRDNGSTIDSFGPIYPLTPPVLGNFTWVNQSSNGSATTTYGGIYLASAGGVAGYDFKLLVNSAPAAPYKATMCLLPNGAPCGNNTFMGICLRNSSSGKIVTFGLGAGNAPFIRADKWDSPTALDSGYYSTESWIIPCPVWLQIYDDNTNRNFNTSADGQNFALAYQIGRTDFITPDQVGFHIGDQSGTSGRTYGMTVLSWAQG
jgi:hypothetical protein